MLCLQRFGYSFGPGCNQPQHPRTPQDLHPQSRTNGKSRWTSNLSSKSSNKDRSHLLGFSSSAGRNGVSITLVTQYDIHLVHSIEEQNRELGSQSGLSVRRLCDRRIWLFLQRLNWRSFLWRKKKSWRFSPRSTWPDGSVKSYGFIFVHFSSRKSKLFNGLNCFGLKCSVL